MILSTSSRLSYSRRRRFESARRWMQKGSTALAPLEADGTLKSIFKQIWARLGTPEMKGGTSFATAASVLLRTLPLVVIANTSS
jgi:hypothetical protein